MSVNYNPATPTDGLVLCIDPSNPRCYPGSGTTVFDLSGNNNNGTLTNGASVVNTRGGRALDFDGSNDYVDAGDCCDFTSGFMTISAWVKRNETTTADRAIVTKFGRSGGVASEDGYGFRFYANNLEYFAVLNAATHTFSTTTANFNTTDLMHVAVTVETNNGASARLYRNGIVQTASWTLLTGNVTLENNAYSLRLGNYRYAGVDYGHFAGLIDDVRIYNRALTESEIRQLFESKRGKYL